MKLAPVRVFSRKHPVSYLAPYWLISPNTITFHKDFWCSRFCEFHGKGGYPQWDLHVTTLHSP